ncbi:MAG: NAD(P)H-hydrate dehydratase [Ruegeria sp.]
MTELLTAAQMREIEQAAIKSGQVTGLELMERAGRGVLDAIFDEWPELRGRGASPSRSLEYLGKDEADALRAVVFCGPGNNGGDGFVVTRILRELGWQVEVFLYGDPARLPPDARENYDLLSGEGRPREWSASEIVNLAPADLYVDAVFGAGLTRAPSSEIMDPLAQLYVSGKSFGRMVCIDAPAGLCMDSGRALNEEFGAVSGFLTVTFHRKRLGHVLSDGPEYCGVTSLVDIGLDSSCEGAVSLLNDWSDVEIRKSEGGYKYSHGHAFVLTGGAGKTGAARLAARGALRIGAGLVTLGVPPTAQLEAASQITAIMLLHVEDAVGLSEVLRDERLNALCLGPALGLERARFLVPAALEARRPTVLDADALTAFADDPETLFGILHENCVLTPHGGEFACLFPDIAEKLRETPKSGPAFSKVDATRAAAHRAGCVVVHKGPDTVIAAPDGRCAINLANYERAAPWLATAGSGDVLAGFITGLLARGFAPMQAAEGAAWLHVEAARQFGPGLIAEDLPEMLPAVFQKLGI